MNGKNTIHIMLKATPNFLPLIPLLCGLAQLDAAAAVSYSLKNLGPLQDLGGRNESRPNAINEIGQVAGVNAVSGAYRAMAYTGSWTNLGTLGGEESFAGGINDLGVVVGYSLTVEGAHRAFVWTPGGTDGVAGNPEMKDLGTLGGANSEAYAINHAGEISGYSQTSSQGKMRDNAFIYSGGKFKNIGTLMADYPNSFAYSINNHGQVAGTAYDAGYGTCRAFYYDGKTATVLGTLGGASSSGLRLSDIGQLAGYATTSSGMEHAFRWANGVMTDLGTLGGDYSYGLGINSSNVIVGGSFVDAKNSVYHAFIATGNSMTDLNAQLDDTGAGWTLIEARAINDNGQIAGVGLYQGESRAFLLSPALVSSVRIAGVSLAGNNVQIRFNSAAASTYSLESCSDLGLAGWTPLVTGIKGTGGEVTVTDSGAGSLPRRFYRLKLAGQ
jgi:probable HAF family extracellular repeat protein